MASLQGLAQSLKKKLLDSTTLDEKFGVGMNRVKTAFRQDPSQFFFASPTALNRQKQTFQQLSQGKFPGTTGTFKSPVLKALGGLGSDFAGSMERGASNVQKGISQIRSNPAQGLARTAFGTAQFLQAPASITPPNLARAGVSGLLGGGINSFFAKRQGNDPAQAFGQGFGQGARLSTITKFTDPITGSVASKLSPIGKNLLGRQLITRGVTGLGNVIEDKIIDKVDQKPRTRQDDLTSFLIGGAIGGNDEILDLIKKSKAGNLTESAVKKVLEKGGESARRLNMPVNQLEFDPKTQTSRMVSRPVWQWMLKDQTGAVGADTPEYLKKSLKPKKELLKQAESLRSAGSKDFEQAISISQTNKELRSSISQDALRSVSLVKQIAKNDSLDFDGIARKLKQKDNKAMDNLLESFGTSSEDEAIQKALDIPSRIDTFLVKPDSILEAERLEKIAKQARDIVFNSETDLKTKEKVIENPDLRKKADIDFMEWQKAFNQSLGLKTPKQNEQRSLREISKSVQQSTIPGYANPISLRDISNIDKGFKDVYRNFEKVFGNKYPEVKNQILNPFDQAKGEMVDNLTTLADDLDNNIVKKYGFKSGSKESQAIQQFGEGNISKEYLIKKFGNKKAQQIIEADKFFRSRYDKLLSEVNAIRKKIYPNDSEKIIPKRRDYYRHFREMDGIRGLLNIFETPAGISPELEGISATTQPYTKWLSFAQKRLGLKTKEDAIGGYINYVKSAEYAKNIDPFIPQFRKLREDLITATNKEGVVEYGKLNNFINYLEQYANDLSGKTNQLDRIFQEIVPGGRKTFTALNWLNSRIKANVIVGNLSSSIAQFFNIPQGIAEAGLPSSARALGDTLISPIAKTTPIDESNFIKERFSSDIFDKFNTGVINNTKKFAIWLTQFGDEVGTKYVWNAQYRKALSQNIANPIKYADDMTRSLVAGRGIGEVPLMQKSKVFQLIAPFQLEVANVWHVMGKWAGEKNAKKFMYFFVSSFLMNKVAEQIRGSGVGIDPIQAGIDSYQTFQDEEDKKVGAMKVVGRMGGEALSNFPLGQSVASLYPEFGFKVGEEQFPTREKLFGEGDPTRYGSGLLTAKGIQDPIFKVLPPFGGAQAKRSLDGILSFNKGYSETPSGRVRYPIEKNTRNAIQSSLFGQYSVPEAKAYFKSGTSALGEKQSDLLKNSTNKKTLYASIVASREKNKLIDKAKEDLKNGNETSKRVENTFVYLDSNGDAKTIDLNFTPSTPQLTGNKELDTKLISKYKGEITSKANDIRELYLQGQLTADEAEQELIKLENMRPKKAKKVSIKSAPKVKVPAIKNIKAQIRTTQAQLPKIQMSLPKKANIKLLSNNTVSPAQLIRLAQPKRKKIAFNRIKVRTS